MATTAAIQTDEQRLVQQAIEEIALPKDVRLKSVKLGADWEGDPAWRVTFSLSKHAPSDPAFIRTLNQVIDEVIERVTGLQTNKFPYVSFVAARVR